MYSKSFNGHQIESLADYSSNIHEPSYLEREIEMTTKQITSVFRELSLHELLEIQAIMYLGIYQDYNPQLSTERILQEQLEETGHGTDLEIEIKQMVEKVLFHQYLLKGCEILHIAV